MGRSGSASRLAQPGRPRAPTASANPRGSLRLDCEDTGDPRALHSTPTGGSLLAYAPLASVLFDSWLEFRPVRAPASGMSGGFRPANGGNCKPRRPEWPATGQLVVSSGTAVC